MKLLELLMLVCPELVFFAAGLFILFVAALCLRLIRWAAPKEMWKMMRKEMQSRKR